MKPYKRFLLFSFISLLILLVGLTGCPVDDPRLVIPGLGEPEEPGEPEEQEEPKAIGNYSGTATAEGGGFASTSWVYEYEHGDYGSPITVTVTMVDGWITSVIIDGPNETPDIGGAFIANAPNVIKAKNTFDLTKKDVDSVSAASAGETFNGIKEAGNKAIEEIKEKWEAAHRLSLTVQEILILDGIGDTGTINVTWTPVDLTPVFTPNDSTIVTVDVDGEVTAHKSGEFAVITVTLTPDEGDPLTAKCLVYVMP